MSAERSSSGPARAPHGGEEGSGSKSCRVDDCTRDHYALGLCKLHWRRQNRTGDAGEADYRRRPVVPETCQVDGCDRPHSGRDLCQMHLRRLRDSGDVGNVEPMVSPRPLCRADGCVVKVDRGGFGYCSEHRFEGLLWERVQPTGSCWLWTGHVGANGYARLKVDGRMVKAHRVVYQQLVGTIPDGLVLDHLCRIRHCVNPDHLEPVTQAENVTRRNQRRQHDTTRRAA